MQKIVVQAVIGSIDGGTRCTYFFVQTRCSCAGHTHCEEIDMCQTRVTGMSSSLLVWTPVDEEPEGQRVARGMVVGASVGPTRGPEDPPSHCPHQD